MMPFGLKNAPSIFQRFIYNIFRDLIHTREIVVYINDILIASEDKITFENFEESSLSRGLEIKLKKCKFVFKQIEFLGYIVSFSGLRPTETHLTVIENFPISRNQK